MDEDDYYWFFEELTGRCEALVADGPATSKELAGRLEAERFFDELDAEDDPYAQPHADLVDDVLSGSDSLLHSSVDDRWHLIEDAFDGRVFVHRLRAEEIQGNYLTITDGLAIAETGLEELDWLFSGQVPYTEASSSERWEGRPGWLADFSPGDLCAITRVDGDLSISPIGAAEVGDGIRELEVMTQWLTELSPGVGGYPATWLYDWLTYDRQIFTQPVLPFSELMEAVGFEEREGCYGLAGEPWVPPYIKRRAEQLDDIIKSFDLDRTCREKLEVVMNAWWAQNSSSIGRETEVEVDYREAASSLSHSFVAAAFEACLDESDALAYNDEYPLFLAALSATSGRASAASDYLLGRHMILREGRTLDGVEAYKRAVRADDKYPLAQDALAEIEFYEGRFEEGTRRLQRSGMRSSELQSLAPQQDAATSYQAGRNDPCPCGSGRKFKTCHAGRPATEAISARKRLNAKVQRFLFEEEQTNRIRELRMTVFGQDDRSGISNYSDLEFTLDLACHEGAMFAEFIDTYGVLLADDEFTLAEARVRTRRDLYEVVGVDVGQTITMRNVRDGEAIVVQERTASQNVRDGEYLLARLLIDGPETDQPTLDSDPISVDMRHRDDVLAALDEHDPTTSMIELALWFRRASTPPSLQLGDSLQEALSDEEIELFESGEIWSTLPKDREPPPRPQPGSPEYEIICEVIAEHEESWITESIPALKGATPVEAADDPTQRADLLRLLDSMPQTTDPTVMSGLRLRQALGLD